MAKPKIPQDIQIGSIHKSTSSGLFKVIEYKNSRNITVEFANTGYVSDKATAASVRSGLIRDKLSPSLFNIGFIGVGGYEASEDRKDTKAYKVWSGMFKRCYSESSLRRSPSYKGCSVCIEWHNFQNFAKWFDENYIEGYQLDKDIKIEGNKVYSPEACSFVSLKDNSIKANAKSYSITSPNKVIVTIYNLSEFCEINNLDRRSMTKVISGERREYKGWSIT